MQNAFKVILLSWSLLTSFAQEGLGQNGAQTGLTFLRVGVGARATGLGEAYTSLSDDATATYWNPAALARLGRTQLAFTHTEWLQDISSEFLAFAFPALGGGLGLSVYSNNVGGIERRVNPSETPLGTIEAHDLAVGLSYGRAFSSSLSAGMSLKYLYEKIYIESASGYAFDFGLLFRPSAGNFTVAVTAQNLGSMGDLRQQSIDLPSTFRFGLSYRLGIDGIDGGLVFSADAVKVKGLDARGNFGAELELLQYLAFRIGYQSGYDNRGPSGGIGILYKRYHVDYGYVPFDSNLGDTHRISIMLDL